MYFVKTDLKKKDGFYKRTKVLAILEDFKDSDIEVAKLTDWNYASAKTGANTFNQSIKHYKIAGVRAFARNNEIYLVRIDD